MLDQFFTANTYISRMLILPDTQPRPWIKPRGCRHILIFGSSAGGNGGNGFTRVAGAAGFGGGGGAAGNMWRADGPADFFPDMLMFQAGSQLLGTPNSIIILSGVNITITAGSNGANASATTGGGGFATAVTNLAAGELMLGIETSMFCNSGNGQTGGGSSGVSPAALTPIAAANAGAGGGGVTATPVAGGAINLSQAMSSQFGVSMVLPGGGVGLAGVDGPTFWRPQFMSMGGTGGGSSNSGVGGPGGRGGLGSGAGGGGAGTTGGAGGKGGDGFWLIRWW